MIIEVPTGEGSAEAWLTGESGPGVLLIMDAIGLRPRIYEMADRIASWGYVVLAPNVFHRFGRAGDLAPEGPLTSPGAREAFFAQAMPRVQGLTASDAASDCEAWLDALRAQPGVREPFGVVGYCMGARIATRVAGAHPELIAACGGFHGGGLVTDAPDSPHLSLATAKAEFLYGHADNDGSMGPDAIAGLEGALVAAGLVHTNGIYPDAPHGYSMSDTSMYHEAATERHFAELEALFARRLH
ncbi:MAG TPA: dienelactone hydrolase family protein [Propionibacteriaceae bacterium]|nr:dienelactone hydrolase family protein [Propionibacteriaceae bacterium]